MQTKNKYTPSIGFLALSMQFILHVSSANAAVIITLSSGSTPFAVSSSDLLQTALSGSPVVTGIFNAFGTSGETVLRDGSDGGASSIDFSTTAIIATGSSVTYTFDVGANPLGYILTEINTFGGWDEGRDAQNINIFYSTIQDPSTFLLLSTIAFEPPSPNQFSRVGVTPNIGEPFLATDVHSIRFVFPTQEAGAGGYRELDVVGQAVPEPSAAFLLGASALAFVGIRKRTNKK